MCAPLCSADPNEIFDREVIGDPHPFLARVRRDHPISRVAESGVHLVASWALIDEALRRDDDFSANLTGVLVRGEDGLPAIFEFGAGASQVIATADEPRHSVHRALAQPGLAQRRVHALEPRMRAWTREALTPWLAAGGGDFVPVAETVPARSVAHLLGLPDGDVQRYRTWAMMGGDMLAGSVSAERLAGFAHETGRMVEYLRQHLEVALEAPERGPAVFDAPDALRLDRRHPKQHLSFGRGSHFCIGAPLARLEARVVVEEILANTRCIAIRPGASPVHAHSIFVRRLEQLPLVVEC
jgi:cytochrome P450